MAASGQLRPFRFIIALPVEILTGKRGFFQLEVRPALPAVALCVVLSLAGLAALYALFVLAMLSLAGNAFPTRRPIQRGLRIPSEIPSSPAVFSET